MIRPQPEIETMLKKFDDASDANELDTDSEGARDALLWVLGHTGDDTVKQYLPVYRSTGKGS